MPVATKNASDHPLNKGVLNEIDRKAIDYSGGHRKRSCTSSPHHSMTGSTVLQIISQYLLIQSNDWFNLLRSVTAGTSPIQKA